MPSKGPTASSRNYEHKSAVQFQHFVFAVLSAAAVYVSPRPPSSVHVVAVMVRQQPHFEVSPL